MLKNGAPTSASIRKSNIAHHISIKKRHVIFVVSLGNKSLNFAPLSSNIETFINFYEDFFKPASERD